RAQRLSPVQRIAEREHRGELGVEDLAAVREAHLLVAALERGHVGHGLLHRGLLAVDARPGLHSGVHALPDGRDRLAAPLPAADAVEPRTLALRLLAQGGLRSRRRAP